jgi:hypothetical protein
MRVRALPLSCLLVASLANEVGHAAARPQLSLRAMPRVAFSPSGVIFTGELRGGDDLEEFHCPAVEWDWDDGSRSTRESDCDPFQAESGIERRFTARHVYRDPGQYVARLTLTRGGRAIAAATINVAVRGPFGPDEE